MHRQLQLPRIVLHSKSTANHQAGQVTSMNQVSVEICVGDLTAAMAAAAGGAHRIELCADVAAGGTTPSAGVIAESCRRLPIPVHVLIRPREGDFVYSGPELAVMRHDIEIAKACGAAGVVLGVLTRAAAIDGEQTAALVAVARPVSVTFHRAFDQTRDLQEALGTLVSLGVDRVLTAGGRPTALAGIEALTELVVRARNKIVIMAGGRLGSDQLETVIRRSGVREVHLGSAVTRLTQADAINSRASAFETSRPRTDARKVAAVVELVASLDVQSING
jgi:copper homeostasis protein